MLCDSKICDLKFILKIYCAQNIKLAMRHQNYRIAIASGDCYD